MPAEELELFRAMLPRLQQTTLPLQRAGVTLLAGTDIAADRVPGFSLHDELDLLAEAGLTPLQVLQAATIQPAKVMRVASDYGTVEPGKVADLVVLEADPVRNVTALHHIAAVVSHGQLLDRRALDRLLIAASQRADAS